MSDERQERTAPAPDWAEFRARHEELFRAAGLPPSVTETEDRWVDFLRDGRLDHHSGSAPAEPRDPGPGAYEALLQLATRYFEEGGLFLTPMALRPDDQRRLADRFGGPESRPPA